ncbi:hypothetical protein ACFRMN_19505 [Streptomyces sp. NPDC056835]|uniref:hypothetical protein n=1 Tax=Streptomyces sp. NPDC056835 TaxID=3345956 RepID=UPI0036C9C0A0
MDTSTKATLAAGVAAGYVVGRTKNGKLALVLLSAVAGRSLDPLSLIGQGVRKLAESPQFGQLGEQVRGELLNSGRSALSGMANRRVTSLTEALQQRTRSLLESEAEEEPEGAEEEPEEDEEAEDRSAEAEEDDTEEPPRRSRRRPSRSASAEKPTDRKPGPKNPPAKKAMEKKAADRKAAKDKASGRTAARKPVASRGRRR